MTRKLTEAHAWRRLAEWCVGNAAFLCNRMTEWEGQWDGCKPPFRAPWREMRKRIGRHAEEGRLLDWDGPDAWYTYPQPFAYGANNHARVIFCLLMALECEEEG